MATKVERWMAADGTEFYTCKAAEDHDSIAVAVYRFMEPETRHHGYRLLRKMSDAGYHFAPPPMANPPA